MEDNFEKLGTLIDDLDNLTHALKLPLPPQMHIDQMTKALPEIIESFKKIYQEITGDNPWD